MFSTRCISWCQHVHLFWKCCDYSFTRYVWFCSRALGSLMTSIFELLILKTSRVISVMEKCAYSWTYILALAPISPDHRQASIDRLASWPWTLSSLSEMAFSYICWHNEARWICTNQARNHALERIEPNQKWYAAETRISTSNSSWTEPVNV